MDGTTDSTRLEGRELRRWEARARVVKAMAHPTRLYLLDQLSRQERCVCELTAGVGADVSTVSKHLAVLRGAGLVLDERRGSQVFYRLRVPCALGVFDCIDGVLGAEAAAREDVLPPRHRPWRDGPDTVAEEGRP